MKKSFAFLFISKEPCCGDLRQFIKAVPRSAELSLTDGDVWVYWTTQAKDLGTAVGRAITFVQKIQVSSGIDWTFDDDFEVESNGKSEKHSFHDLPVPSKELSDIGLW